MRQSLQTSSQVFPCEHWSLSGTSCRNGRLIDLLIDFLPRSQRFRATKPTDPLLADQLRGRMRAVAALLARQEAEAVHVLLHVAAAWTSDERIVVVLAIWRRRFPLVVGVSPALAHRIAP